ncbi:cytochrome P450 [Fistulina hepatica ATCC 64428]|uniref:Cytochrome P450 n=1 Tax=Fistulina hepatica ATCC 64428 TaxID=1128425 RepID=A0A0D7AKW5_9AGAR|nr:cytochrome P450 [Fistulina hepatica ATCC 64428]
MVDLYRLSLEGRMGSDRSVCLDCKGGNRRWSIPIRRGFTLFDMCFPLLAADMIPSFLFRFIPAIRNGIVGRDAVAEQLQQWVSDGLPGLEEGLIKDMADIFIQEGWPLREIGLLLNSDLWASQANAPPIAVALLVRVMQSTSLQEQLRAEFEQSGLLERERGLTIQAMNEAFPLASSCVWETLRLETSSFSIRIAQENFLFDVGDRLVAIPKGARLVAATRTAHLCDPLWGDNSDEWDGQRFMIEGSNQQETERIKARMLKEIRGFGGGVSMCEGRHLALSELKAVLAMMLLTFDMRPVISPDDKSEYRPLKLKGVSPGIAHAPLKEVGRPGMGAFQFCEGSDMTIRISLRE